jgi:hypothetical protein
MWYNRDFRVTLGYKYTLQHGRITKYCHIGWYYITPGLCEEIRHKMIQLISGDADKIYTYILVGRLRELSRP